MKVRVNWVGERREVEWPEGWPVPHVGDEIDLGESGSFLSGIVRTVVWYPNGEEIGEEPFVYVVAGRRSS